MTLKELGIIARTSLKFSEDVKGRQMCEFENSEIKDTSFSGVIGSRVGRGSTKAIARADYVRNLRGRILVIDARGRDRREFVIPETLRA